MSMFAINTVTPPVFGGALELSTSHASQICSPSSSSSPLSSPLSSSRSRALKDNYPSNILNGPRLRPVPLPALSDEETVDNPSSFSPPSPPRRARGRETPSSALPSPESSPRFSLLSPLPLNPSWHVDLDVETALSSPNCYPSPHHYHLPSPSPSPYTPPTPPPSTAHLVCAPATAYRQLPRFR